MKSFFLRISSVAGVLTALAVQFFVKNHRRHPVASHPYFSYLLLIILVVFAALFAASFFSVKVKAFLEKHGPRNFIAFAVLTILNVLTAKTAVLPPLLFPSFDNIVSVFVESRGLIFKCIIHSFKLLGIGAAFGIFLGVTTGITLRFSRRADYWLNPVIKIIGPIPATAWIPFALVVFPTTFGASIFIIALAVWFPVVLLTSSGIKNIPNSYFEVGRTLGTKPLYQIFRIGIPAALPDIFQGIFFGICSSFIALMTAEMFGAKAGIGWFINMEKEMAEFKGVYAGLILIALFCNIIITLLLKIRGKVLSWQKGLIKW